MSSIFTTFAFRNASQNRATRSIWVVGLPVWPPVHLPGLLVSARLVSHAPAAARALYSGPQAAARRLQCLPRPTARQSTRPVVIATVLLLYIDPIQNLLSLKYNFSECYCCKGMI